MTKCQFAIKVKKLVAWTTLLIYLLIVQGCNIAPNSSIIENEEATTIVATPGTPSNMQIADEFTPSARATETQTITVTTLPNESPTATLIPGILTPIHTATNTLTPTPTVIPTTTPILFLTVAAAKDGCILNPEEADMLTMPLPNVLIGSSGPDTQFCILWHSDDEEATSFVVEVQYANDNNVYSYTVPSDTNYFVLPENEAPNCSNRRSFHISVYAIIAESQRIVGGMGVSDGCYQ